jgi:hypothetical protein
MRRNSQRQQRRPAHIRHPFFEIGGDVYVMLDWFALEDGSQPRDQIVLTRLTPGEVRMYDEYRATADEVGLLAPEIRKLLARSAGPRLL